MTHFKLNNNPALKRYDSFFTDLFNLPGTWPAANEGNGHAAANVYETTQAYFLELSVPGRNKEDFKINLDKNLLTISFDKKEEKEAEGVTSIRREFNFNSFKRTFTLDDKIDTSNIQAKYDNGILKIELPKKEHLKAEPKEITIG